MAEIISHPKFKKKPVESSERQRFEQHRREHASRIEREAEKIAQHIYRHSKIQYADRHVFACNMHFMLRQLEQKAQHLPAVAFQEAIGTKKEDSTKRRGRFARGKNDLKTPLAADGKQWINLARAVGKHLHGENRAIFSLVQGSSFLQSNAPLLSASDLREEAARTAEYLDEIASWVVHRNNLVSYFETLRHGSYSINDEGLFCPDNWVFSIDPTWLVEGFGMYLYDFPYILPAIPKVPLYSQSIWIPARGTKLSLDQINHDPDAWDELAMIGGYEEFEVKIEVDLSLGICPLNKGTGPIAVFIAKAPRLSLGVWDKLVKTNGNTALAGDWVIFPYNTGSTEEWSALMFYPDTPLQEAVVNTFELFKPFQVSPEMCLKFLAEHCYEGGEIILQFDDIYPDGEELDRHPTAAPNRTILSALQRNLAYKDDNDKISSRLDEDAARLARLLESRREDECHEFHRRMEQMRGQWRISDTEE